MTDATVRTPDTERNGSAPVTLRRAAWLPAVIAVAAGAMGALYLWRAVTGGGGLAWMFSAALLLLAVYHLGQWRNTRTPLLVADGRGIRIPLGESWHGLLWSDVASVEVRPQRGLRHPGMVAVHPRDSLPLETLDGTGRRICAANTKRYGAPMAASIGPTTVVSASDLSTALARLSGDAVEIRTPPVDVNVAGEPRDESATEQNSPARQETPPESSPVASPPPAPARVIRKALRVDVTRAGASPPIAGQLALQKAEADPDRSDNSSDGTLDAVSLVPPPEKDDADSGPVIGPQIVQARQLLGMSVDELSTRTRIRPHVLEAAEVDDFGPCGGDFYARGHLKTLARTLGLNGEELLADYEDRYAATPVSPRQVFEAELASGDTGAIRSVGSGGPRWGALIATVLILVLIWGVASYFTGGEADPLDNDVAPAPSVSTGSGGLPSEKQKRTVISHLVVRLQAEGDTSWVAARTVEDELLFGGLMRDGQVRRVKATEALRLRIDNAGVINVTVNGKNRGFLGAAGERVHVLLKPQRVWEPRAAH